jgi:hypothetical protein
VKERGLLDYVATLIGGTKRERVEKENATHIHTIFAETHKVKKNDPPE